MKKKKAIAPIVLGVLAASALPASASAAELLNEKEELVLVGESIQLKSTNLTLHMDTGAELECSETVLNGTVVENASDTVEVGTDEATESRQVGCRFNGYSVLKELHFEGLTATGIGPGDIHFWESWGPGLCAEQSVAPSTVTWSGSNEIGIETRISGGCGAGPMYGDFELWSPEGEVIFTD